MIGKILLYRIEEGTGLILTQDHSKYPFDVYVWNDFDNMPEAGMVVEFQLLDKQIATLKKAKNQESEESSSNEEISTSNFNEENSEEKAFKSVKIDEYSVKTVAEGTMDKTLDLFFKDLTNTVIKFKHTSNKEEKHQLEYFAIKRFLFTAYNMLRDRDSSLVDISLAGLLDNLREISGVYEIYKRSKKQPKIAFKSIFLKYTKYKEAKNRLEFNIGEMTKLGHKADSLAKEIKLKTAILQKVDKEDPRLPDAINMLKKMKSIYVDNIDSIGTLREENEKLVPITNEYYDEFFEDFLTKFNQSYEENMKMLKQILDSLAYTFDKVMWERAQNSKAIKHYFEESNIEGDFSTLTFLKYYLKSLDQTKLNEEHQSLMRLQQYLEKKDRE